MPRLFIEYLQGQNIYCCKKCGTHFTSLSQLISQAFRGHTGTAYLFNNAINIKCGALQQKRLLSGIHHTCDIYCIKCNNNKPVGWKYVRAMDQDQKYKQGKFILELQFIKKQNWIDD